MILDVAAILAGEGAHVDLGGGSVGHDICLDAGMERVRADGQVRVGVDPPGQPHVFGGDPLDGIVDAVAVDEVGGPLRVGRPGVDESPLFVADHRRGRLVTEAEDGFRQRQQSVVGGVRLAAVGGLTAGSEATPVRPLLGDGDRQPPSSAARKHRRPAPR
ncbi:MAG: hypothetical protein V1757_01510 [Actinomycetota bacterium]